jgi:thiosulfate/3-mercaptopyruvate sulfurtransferase
MPNDPFVDIAGLRSLGPVRYLDARDQAAFDAGHAPGAVRVPVDEWDKAAKAADIGFGKTAYWDEALGSVGVDLSVVAVAYDSGQMTNAARVWFILQYFGLRAVILNGGWPVLSSATGLPAGAAPAKGGFQGGYHARPGAGLVGLVDRQTLKRQLDGDAHVFDTRTRAEFTGEDTRNRPRSGHLPGARHLSHVDLLENGVVRPAPALRAMLDRAGFGPGDHIVTHCEGGGRAALGAAAAVRAGFDDVRVYYLSFADWVRDESCPVVRD